MKLLKTVTGILLLIIPFMLSGCNNNKVEDIKEEENKNKYTLTTSVLAYRAESGKSKVYSLDEGKKNLLYEFDDMIDLKYNKESNTLVKKEYVENGDELIRSKLVIVFKGKEIVLDSFYSVADFKLSKDGTKVAFRAYLQDNLGTIDNVKIYDLETSKYIPFKTEVIISGDQYNFSEEGSLIYYGVNKEKGKNSIFSFDLESSKEEEVYKVDNGIIKCLYVVKDSLLFLKQDFEENKFIEFDMRENKETALSKNYEDIYGVVYNDLIYFLGKEKSNKISLYKIDNRNIKRITFDFPRNICTTNNISRDDKGNIYITGYEEKSSDRELFLVKKDNSINLIDDKLKNIDIYWNE